MNTFEKKGRNCVLYFNYAAWETVKTLKNQRFQGEDMEFELKSSGLQFIYGGSNPARVYTPDGKITDEISVDEKGRPIENLRVMGIDVDRGRLVQLTVKTVATPTLAVGTPCTLTGLRMRTWGDRQDRHTLWCDGVRSAAGAPVVPDLKA